MSQTKSAQQVQYDVLVILKPIVDVDTSDTAVKAVESAVETLKGKIVKHEKLGRKRLAYEIKKFKDAFLSTMIVEMDAEAIEPFKRACHLNEDVLRLMVTRRIPNQPEFQPTASRPAPGGRREFGDRRGGDQGPREPRPQFQPQQNA